MAKEPPDPKFVLRGSPAPVSSLSFLYHTLNKEFVNCLASGTQEGECFIWNLKVKSLETRWRAHRSSVLWQNALDTNSLWTCGRSEAAVLWDLETGTPREKLRFPISDYMGFSQCDIVRHSSRTILVIPGSSSEGVTVWDTDSGVKICCLVPPDFMSYGTVMQCKLVSFNDNLRILSAYENGSINLWDFHNKKIISEIQCHQNPLSIEYDQILKQGVCGTVSNNVYIFSLQQDSLSLETEKEYTVTNPGIGCITSRADSKLYAMGGWDSRIRIFSWKKHKPLAVMTYHKKSVECIQYSSGPVEFLTQGYLLAAGSSDHSISLWDIYNT